MLSFRSSVVFPVMTATASLLGLATAGESPWDTPGMGHGSTSASYTFTTTVDGQNTCGNDALLAWDSTKLPIDDCVNLRDSHADANLTGSYTYNWETPGNVPANTFIYGPYYGDCMINWFPYDYTQSFTIGNQDIYDIVNTAIGRGNQSWSILACQAGSGQPMIVDWEVGSIKASSGSGPGAGPFGNIG